MTKRLHDLALPSLAAALALTLATPAARAGGINLSWDDCGAFGSAVKTSACLSNSGLSRLVGSAIAPVPMSQLVSQLSVVEIQTTAATLSDWWQMRSTGCRSSVLVASGNFGYEPLNCVDPWQGTAYWGIDYAPGYGGANRARLRTTCAVVEPVVADGVNEMYLWVAVIYNRKTVGVGSCAGCTDGACFIYTDQILTQPIGVGDYDINNPILRRHVVWQANGLDVPGGCDGMVPVKNNSWGAIKSLYR
jgi:hypothetical protein